LFYFSDVTAVSREVMVASQKGISSILAINTLPIQLLKFDS
jgi:hypothetical protein